MDHGAVSCVCAACVTPPDHTAGRAAACRKEQECRAYVAGRKAFGATAMALNREHARKPAGGAAGTVRADDGTGRPAQPPSWPLNDSPLQHARSVAAQIARASMILRSSCACAVSLLHRHRLQLVAHKRSERDHAAPAASTHRSVEPAKMTHSRSVLISRDCARPFVVRAWRSRPVCNATEACSSLCRLVVDHTTSPSSRCCCSACTDS